MNGFTVWCSPLRQNKKIHPIFKIQRTRGWSTDSNVVYKGGMCLFSLSILQIKHISYVSSWLPLLTDGNDRDSDSKFTRNCFGMHPEES